MISDADLLFIEPKLPASRVPIVDELTRRMAAAFRISTIGGEFRDFCGVHECVCGALSDNNDHALPNGRMTNSLCVHYVAYHRAEIPPRQLQEVAALPWGEVDPTEEELVGRKFGGRYGRWQSGGS